MEINSQVRQLTLFTSSEIQTDEEQTNTTYQMLKDASLQKTEINSSGVDVQDKRSMCVGNLAD